MAGLLEALNSDEGMQALGLLAAAGPSATPMSFGQRLFGAMQQSQSMKKAEEDRKLKALLMNTQIQDMLAQAQERTAQADKLKQGMARDQSFMTDLSGNLVSPSQALSSGGGPTPENAAKIGQPTATDWMQLAKRYGGRICPSSEKNPQDKGTETKCESTQLRGSRR